MELKTDLIDLCFNNSIKQRKEIINGELYVSKDKKRKKKIEKIKEKVLYTVAGVLVSGILLSGAGIAGVFDASTDVMKEITTRYTYMDSYGNYVTEFVYDEDFRDDMLELSDFELMSLFDDTSKEMKEEGYKDEARNLENVVKRMSINYKNSKEIVKKNN